MSSPGKITRRDILHGAGVFAAAPLLGARAQTTGRPYYPPALTGLRGSHEGSYETAHALAREGRREFGELVATSEDYDLVVVGGGVSGLAAAYFYRQRSPDARILVLDNHDDFGGHAKRNEFTIGDHTLIGYGGSQTMESPSAYSAVSMGLLRELAVDMEAFETAYDRDFYKRNGLRGGLFFDRETYGRNAFVAANLFGTSSFLDMDPGSEDTPKAINRMPLSQQDRDALIELVTSSRDALDELNLFELPDYLSSVSYLDFLKNKLGITSSTLLNLLQHLPSGYFGIGIDGITALDALTMGMPGGQRLGLPGWNWLRDLIVGISDPYIHHFPDGNASIARLLVRSLIPETTSAANPEALVSAVFDYNQLDRAEHRVRVRLSSTAVSVDQNQGQVHIDYVNQGLRRATAKHCVLACYNSIIPYLCPGLPADQKVALAEQVKVPLVYTNVALNNWRALKELGIGQCFAPNMFHKMMMVDFPVTMGRYRFSRTPDDPVVLHLSSAFGANGLHPKEQFKIGRARLLGTTYQQIEDDTFNFLDQLLEPAGFKSQRDVAAVTVNRWPHGYAYGKYTLFDPEYEPGQAPHEIGRRTWQRIAIANSDAGARAYLDEAIDQAHRAVAELDP